MTQIKVKSINVIREDRQILHDVTYTFQSGEITALLGPSGAGKTTLLKLINGLHSPESGEICFDGQSIADMDLIQLRQTAGMALQSAPMINGTVFDNLNLPKSLFGETLTEDRARELLDQVNLDDVPLTQLAKNLSGGQKQRLSIARTLVNHPKILLLDEITSSLDPRSVKEVEKLILDIKQRYQTTIIWITHDVDQAIKVTDRYVMMKQGRVIETGQTSQLTQSHNQSVLDYLAGEES